MQRFQRGDESPLISVLEEFRRITSKFLENNSCNLSSLMIYYHCQEGSVESSPPKGIKPLASADSQNMGYKKNFGNPTKTS